MNPSVDVIIPAYNNFHVLRRCLDSIVRYTPPDVRAIVVLNGCDRYTVAQINQWREKYPNSVLPELTPNQGFVQACNWGIEHSEADILILLNSDTCVTPRWIEKTVRCMESDPTIGIASPISNFCPHNRIEMLPGLDYLQMSALVEMYSSRKYPDVTTPEGFCFAMTRRCLETIGILDPVFNMGYGEESDLSMRANYSGFRTVCIDDLYVFHHGRITWGEAERDRLYNKNKVIFQNRWGKRYREDFEDFRRRNPLKELRQRIEMHRSAEYQPVLWVGTAGFK